MNTADGLLSRIVIEIECALTWVYLCTRVCVSAAMFVQKRARELELKIIREISERQRPARELERAENERQREIEGERDGVSLFRLVFPKPSKRSFQ